MARRTLEDLGEVPQPSEHERLRSRFADAFVNLTCAEVSVAATGIIRVRRAGIADATDRPYHERQVLVGAAYNEQGRSVYTVEVGEDFQPDASFFYDETAGGYVTPDGRQFPVQKGQHNLIHQLLDRTVFTTSDFPPHL